MTLDGNLYRYGYLSSEIFRACRLVVDTGLRAFGWTKEKAIKYMADHTATSLEAIRSEVRGLYQVKNHYLIRESALVFSVS